MIPFSKSKLQPILTTFEAVLVEKWRQRNREFDRILENGDFINSSGSERVKEMVFNVTSEL